MSVRSSLRFRANRFVATSIEDVAQELMDTILGLLGTGDASQHERLAAKIPTGALHFRQTDDVPDRVWGQCVFTFETKGAELKVSIDLCQMNELGQMKSNLVLWDGAEGVCKLTLDKVNLTLSGLKMFISVALQRFHPFSINLTASE